MVKSKFRHNCGAFGGEGHVRKSHGRRSRHNGWKGGAKEADRMERMDPQKMALNELLYADRDNLGNVLRKHWQQDESRRWAKANVKIVSLGPGSFKGADQLSGIIDRLRQQHGAVQKGDVDNDTNMQDKNNAGDFERDVKVPLDSLYSQNDVGYLQVLYGSPESVADYKSDVKTRTPVLSSISSSSSSSSVSAFLSSPPLSLLSPTPKSGGIAMISGLADEKSQNDDDSPSNYTTSLHTVGSPRHHTNNPNPNHNSNGPGTRFLFPSPATSSSSSPTTASAIGSALATKPARRLLTLSSISWLSKNGGHADVVASVPPGSFVALDIDDTLVHTRHSPSFLLTDIGVRMFQAYTHQRFKEFSVKNQHCRRLQNALKDKVAVETCTADVVRELQAKGCWVFALTARFSEMFDSTQKSLLAVGIDLTKTCPFPKQTIEDPGTHAVCREGVIYCNSMDKGMILNRFLENTVFFALITKVKQSQNSPVNSGLIPPSFVFIDDNAAHAHAILANLKVCDTLSIPITCYHYTPLNDDTGAAWDVPELSPGLTSLNGAVHSPTATLASTLDAACAHNATVQAILQKQMQVFVDDNKVLTNREAHRLLNANGSIKTDHPTLVK